MKWQDIVITGRLRGMVPASIRIVERPVSRHEAAAFRDIVQIELSDSPRRADLRFIIGTDVLLDLEDEARLRSWFDACLAARPRTICACLWDVDGSVAFLRIWNGRETAESWIQ